MKPILKKDRLTPWKDDRWKVQIVLLSAIPVLGGIHFTVTTTNPIPMIIYVVMSSITFALYAEDKSRAKQGKWRIPENTLHLCELAGGWIGGFIAQRKLRHKSIKGSYQAVFWAIVIIHLLFWIDWLLLGGTMMRVLLQMI
jgi:uncharacterized membrane protein YsdA (DUF1294 family)